MTTTATFCNAAGGNNQTRIGISSIARHVSPLPYGGWVLESVTSDEYSADDIKSILIFAESSARELEVSDNDSANEWERVAEHAIMQG